MHSVSGNKPRRKASELQGGVYVNQRISSDSDYLRICSSGVLFACFSIPISSEYSEIITPSIKLSYL